MEDGSSSGDLDMVGGALSVDLEVVGVASWETMCRVWVGDLEV